MTCWFPLSVLVAFPGLFVDKHFWILLGSASTTNTHLITLGSCHTASSLVSYQHQLSYSLQHAFKLAASGRMRSRSLSQNISLYFRISNTSNIPKPMPFFFHWPIASVHWCQGTSNLGALLPALSKATDLYTGAFPTIKGWSKCNICQGFLKSSYYP